MPHAFPRASRLRHNATIRDILKHGSSCRAKWFSIHVQTNTLTNPRLAVIVSRRVSPRATDRNRLKRLVRESFRLNQRSLVGLDVVVVVRHPACDAGYSDLRSALATHWPKVQSQCAH